MLVFKTDKAFAQISQADILNMELFIKDALYFSDQYITPATDAAVYQSVSAWVDSPKKSDLWDVKLSLHSNLFFVPNRDRTFVLNQSDLSFFTFQNDLSSAVLPTALGDDKQLNLTGEIFGSEIVLENPRGINSEIMFYPYLQASLGVGFGTDLVVKYSTPVKLKKSEYQVYGFGLKHNIDQYFKENKLGFNFSVLGAYSKEDIRFDFLDITTAVGELGINSISGLVDTYQFQANVSKHFNRFELMMALIYAHSDFEYKFDGKTSYTGFRDIFNKSLEDIYKSKSNFVGEISARYKIYNDFYVQSHFAFGKFANVNVSLQYEF